MQKILVTMLIFLLLTPVHGALPQKTWTIMVYINADNNLDAFGEKDQAEMAQVGSNDWLNVVTLIDRHRLPAQINYIEKNNIIPIKMLGEVDSGNYQVLVDFVEYAAQNYPANYYAVILWNHGSGWKAPWKGISFDESSNNHITIAQLSKAMAKIHTILGQKINVFAMDACLMQMAEVVYAIYQDCEFVVASEETEPGDGYPYNNLLSALQHNSTPKALSRIIVDTYQEYYCKQNEDVTQSAIDCNEFVYLIDHVNGLSKALISTQSMHNITTALRQTQKFHDPSNIDLVHFAYILNQISDLSDVKTACGKLLAATKKAIITNKTCGDKMKNAQGLAIYFPSLSYNFMSEYQTLALAQKTWWDDMIMAYYKQQANDIVNAALAGNSAPLQQHLTTMNQNNAEISNLIYQRLSFETLSTGLSQEVLRLLPQLKRH